ncbi:hypothetical protein [Paludisphaera borealis]|uniref:Uncharacterized protein n=1 Tax=Paludisphaera borealis TaxID=1387353 RepID=A0A1U7CLR2_9BACT|nr:hypothetical protein [Paludisphaera borealis]APW59875.1 hypothetical protein BSF38_01334 [Paludisphaera borealis]
MATRNRLGLAFCCVLILAVAGCQTSGSRRAAAPVEPSLSSSVGGEDRTIIEEPPARTVSYVDRHPLFSKPREYYENSTSNSTIVKAATATFVGVPVGFYSEVKQIFVGAPPPVVR